MHVVESLLERILDSGQLSGDDRPANPAGEILNTNLDAAAIKKRSDLINMDRSLQAELTNKGMVFNKPDPDPTSFRVALQKAGFYAQWQKKYGAEPWTRLEQYTGSLI